MNRNPVAALAEIPVVGALGVIALCGVSALIGLALCALSGGCGPNWSDMR